MRRLYAEKSALIRDLILVFFAIAFGIFSIKFRFANSVPLWFSISSIALVFVASTKRGNTFRGCVVLILMVISYLWFGPFIPR